MSGGRGRDRDAHTRTRTSASPGTAMVTTADGALALALYGSLMRGLPGAGDEPAAELLDRLGVGAMLRRVGSCRFAGRLFDLGAYPAARPARDSSEQIVGELYAVLDPQALAVLDEFEGFDPQHPERSDYLRERIALIQPRAERAWVYHYRLEPDPALRIASGDWRAHLADRRASAHDPASPSDDRSRV